MGSIVIVTCNVGCSCIALSDTPVQLLPPDNADGSVAAVSRASIRCRIIEQARAQTVSDAVSHAQNDVQAMTAAPALIAGIFDDHGHADQVASTFQEAVNTWAPVIESVKQFATLVEGISKVCLPAIRNVSRSIYLFIRRSIRTHMRLGKYSRLYLRCLQYPMSSDPCG